MWISIEKPSIPQGYQTIDIGNLLNEIGDVSQEKLDAYLGASTFTLNSVDGVERLLIPGFGALVLTNTCREYAASGKLTFAISELASNPKEVQLPNMTL